MSEDGQGSYTESKLHVAVCSLIDYTHNHKDNWAAFKVELIVRSLLGWLGILNADYD